MIFSEMHEKKSIKKALWVFQSAS